jgi:hypothetical protein
MLNRIRSELEILPVFTNVPTTNLECIHNTVDPPRKHPSAGEGSYPPVGGEISDPSLLSPKCRKVALNMVKNFAAERLVSLSLNQAVRGIGSL